MRYTQQYTSRSHTIEQQIAWETKFHPSTSPTTVNLFHNPRSTQSTSRGHHHPPAYHHRHSISRSQSVAPTSDFPPHHVQAFSTHQWSSQRQTQKTIFWWYLRRAWGFSWGWGMFAYYSSMYIACTNFRFETQSLTMGRTHTLTTRSCVEQTFQHSKRDSPVLEGGTVTLSPFARSLSSRLPKSWSPHCQARSCFSWTGLMMLISSKEDKG